MNESLGEIETREVAKPKICSKSKLEEEEVKGRGLITLSITLYPRPICEQMGVSVTSSLCISLVNLIIHSHLILMDLSL